MMMNFVTHPLPGEKKGRLLQWVVGILGLLFFLNCFTPLRLHYDMLRYFSIKDCIESKCPPGADPKDYLPIGYTALLLLFSKLGILRSFSIVFVNCLYLAGGLYFVRKIFRDIRSPFFLFILVLLNWTIIKFVLHPLSELQYLFFSLASLYMYCQFVLNRKIGNLILALLLAGIAFLTRTIGIALVAALFSSLIWEYRKQLTGLIRKNKILLGVFVLLIVLVIIFSRQLGLDHYLSVIPQQFEGGLRFSKVLVWHFSEWGELLINAPRVKAGAILHAPYGDWIFFIFGLLGVCVFIYLCFFKKNSIPFVIKAYLFFYLLLMFNWPFPDPRFWVPVVPLIAAVVCQFPISQNRVVRFFTISYGLFYLIIGITALGYMTYTSFNKKELAKTQAKGVFRNEYEIHFFGKTLSDTVTQVDPNLVNFLNKYDR